MNVTENNMSFNAAHHRRILLKLVKAIAEDPSVGPLLGFKGGTAAYLIYGLERDSVDLDFDLLDVSRVDEVFRLMSTFFEPFGTYKEKKRTVHGMYFIISYGDKEPGARNVNIDISIRDNGSNYELVSFVGISMNVMLRADMVANKLLAMYERLGDANRDIFDVWYFLSSDWPINRKIVEDRSGTPFKEYLQKCITALEGMNNAKILDGMGELLTESQKDWTRMKLRTETISQLRILLESEK